MGPPISPAELAPIVERRLAAAMRAIADESEEVAGGGVGFSGIGSWSNQAVGLGFSGPVTAGDVQRIVEFHSSRGAEPKVELAPHADRSAVERLREAGFVINGFEQALIARPAGVLEAAGPMESGIRVEVADLRESAARDQFLMVQTRGLHGDESAEPNEHDRRLFPRYMLQPNTRGVMAFIDGEPAGAAGVELAKPAAQMFGGGTRAAFRRRGVQRALLLARVRLALEAGCEFICTDSAPGGPTERNVIRLGFIPLYTRTSLVRPGEGLAPSP